MKSTRHLYSAHCMLSTVVVALFVGPLSCNKQPNPTHPLSKTSAQSNTNKPMVAPPSVNSAAKTAESEKWILGNNERFIPVVSNLEQHLFRAQTAQNSHNNQLVAIELRAAADSLQPQHKNLIEPIKPDLVAATKNLNQLAIQAESGKTNTQMLMKASVAAYDADLQNGLPTMQTEQWLKTYDQPIARITAARAMLPKDVKGAATELRKAKAYLDIDMARASGTFRQSLNAKNRELGALSDQVAMSKVKDPKELDRTATDVTRTLSELYYHNSKDAWQKHDAVTTAKWLTAAIYNLQQSIHVSGMTIDSSAANALAAAETFARSINSSNNVDAKEMDRQLDETGAELRKLVARVQSASDKSARVANMTRPLGEHSNAAKQN